MNNINPPQDSNNVQFEQQISFNNTKSHQNETNFDGTIEQSNETKEPQNTNPIDLRDIKLENRTTHANVVPVIKNADELSDNDKEKIYDVIAHYSFVTLLNPNNAFGSEEQKAKNNEPVYQTTISGIKINSATGTPDLSDEEKNLLINDEERFLTQKIKEVCKDATLEFIPKSLYQLSIYYTNLNGILAAYNMGKEENEEYLLAELTIKLLTRSESKLSVSKKSMYENNKDLIFQIDQTDAVHSWPQASRTYNTSKVVQKHFWALNQKTAEILLQAYKLFKATYTSVDKLKTTIGIIFEKISSTIERLKENSNTFNDCCGIFEYYNDNPESCREFIKEMIVSEYTAPNNIYRIYRGELPDKCFIEMENKKKYKHSVSFSDGMFGGIISDYRSGSAYTFCMRTQHTLTYIDIPKKHLMDDPQKQYFFIPPVLSIGATTGVGEFHHIRGKLAKGLTLSKNEKIEGFDGRAEHISEEEAPWFYTDKDVIDNLQNGSQKEIIPIKNLINNEDKNLINNEEEEKKEDVANKNIIHISLYDKSDDSEISKQ